MTLQRLYYSLLMACLPGCREHTGKPENTPGVVITIQPFRDLPAAELDVLTRYLRACCDEVKVLKPVPLPASAYYRPRGRYRAEKLLQFLNERTPPGSLTIVLTSKEISTNKGSNPDYGIMGLGLCPGRACVVSGFRLKGQNRLEKFFKVAIHELGHTQGLPHCPGKTCLMRDAEGKDYLNEETGFCARCRAVLTRKGWNLH